MYLSIRGELKLVLLVWTKRWILKPVQSEVKKRVSFFLLLRGYIIIIMISLH